MEETKTVKIGNGNIWTVVTGSGYPLILCSGGPGCSDYMEPVSSLIDDFVRVIRFDPRGCGRSDVSNGYGLKTMLSDLEEIRKQYKVEKWIVAGHSWGADLAIAYTLEYPEVVRGLIYMCGTGIQRDIDWKETYKKGKENGLEEPPTFQFPPNKEINRSLNTSWRKYIKRPKILNEIASIECKSLFVTGSKDIRPRWPVEQISNLVRSSRYEVIEGAGHYIWQTHAEELKILLKEYIEEDRILS